MATSAAERSEPKETKGGDGATWGGRGGANKKDPNLDKICALAYLIVDDSRFARATVKNVLHALGIRNITEVESADQALIAVEKESVDFVIIDFEMPGMSGAEMVWRMRRSKTERIQQMPVVMISNHADENHVRIAINSGVNEFLPKPFSQADLYARVRRAVVNPKPFIVAEGYVGPDRRLKYREGDEKLVSTRGMPPVVLLDCRGPEPKRIEIGDPSAVRPMSEAVPEAAPAAKPQFSVMAESAPLAPPGDEGPSEAGPKPPKG